MAKFGWAGTAWAILLISIAVAAYATARRVSEPSCCDDTACVAPAPAAVVVEQTPTLAPPRKESIQPAESVCEVGANSNAICVTVQLEAEVDNTASDHAAK